MKWTALQPERGRLRWRESPVPDGGMIVTGLIVLCGSGIFLGLAAREKHRLEKEVEHRPPADAHCQEAAEKQPPAEGRT
jgi:hypothetical protein